MEPIVYNFSGGRTSALMIWLMLQVNGGVMPDNIQIHFQNTGKEMPETVCPPGISFAISLFIAFFAKRMLDTILAPNVDWIRVPSTSFVVGVMIGFSNLAF